MFAFDIDASDVLQKASALQRFLVLGTAARLDTLGEQVVRHLQSGHYYRRRTGQANRNTRWVYVDTLARKVVVDTPYAKVLDQGSRPHVIRARRGKALRFVASGQTLLRRVVSHPGTRGFFFSVHEADWIGHQLPIAMHNAASEAIDAAHLG